MDIIEIIKLYNPKFSLNKKNVFMIPVEYLDEVQKLADSYNAKTEVLKRIRKYAFVKWTPCEEVKELS
uniref:ORF67 n=1 Tax=Saccharolobus islandicus TaxID=43080 RepID=O05473_SACIS|nr:hypothetical protein [Sulfolobus islandicus]AAB51527.1 ORF67 [Sulfolobus islandicus]